MVLRTAVARWPFIALMVLAISTSCGDMTPGAPPRDHGAGKAAPEASTTQAEGSTGQAAMTPELRAAYIAAVQSSAGEAFRAEREASGAARFVHLSQGFEATLDGKEVRIAPQEAGSWELSLATTGVDCDGSAELRLPAGAVEIAGNRVEIARGSMREW
ncbi:MAG TPA: hypothetical protein VK459_20205, partial [Polyangiaceae bacterium]|nr:hypothetical protein [Polyangiaceae bacterium]